MLLRPLLLLLLTAWSLSWPPSCSRQAGQSAVPPPVTAASPLPWLDSLLTTSPGLRRHAVGLSLAYADSARPFYDYHAQQYFVPASTLKLLSFYAARHLLGDTLPSLRYFSRHDTLYFQGTGDPTFLHPDVPSRRAYAFLATRPERVLAYCELPTAPAYGPGWAWDDYRYYFQPERGPFPLYGHTVRFYYTPAVPALRRRPGHPARLVVRPRAFRPLATLAPAPAPGPPQGHVRRSLLDNSFVALPAPRRWVDEVPYRTSRALTLRLLGDTLRRLVVAAPWRPHPTRGDVIHTLPGLPADTLYRRMLRVSDNFLAEQLLLMCSTQVGLRDSLSTGRVIREAKRTSLAFLPDAPVWVDGSGLSPLNLLTPRDLTALLCRLHAEVPEHRLLSLLAAGGGPGTLRRRYASANGPWLWAKTGTLRHDLNLCGYLRTRNGRLVAFAFFNNNHPTSSWAVRNEVERVLGQVRRRL